MDFKILINKNAIPVLIEVPEKPSLHPSSWIKGASSLAEASRLYEQAVSTAIADESKHIAFKDERQPIQILVASGILKAMQEYAYQECQQVREKAIQECITIAEKELEDTDDHAGYLAANNIVEKLKELKKP